MSGNATAETLRRLATLIEEDSSVQVCVDTEKVGYHTKTSVVVWTADAPVAAPEPQWCQRLVVNWRGPDTLCGMLLDVNGGCPRHSHRPAVQR